MRDGLACGAAVEGGRCCDDAPGRPRDQPPRSGGSPDSARRAVGALGAIDYTSRSLNPPVVLPAWSPAVRIFDMIGGVVVVAWLASTAIFVVGNSGDAREIGSGAFDLSEGINFIALQQGTEDRGVIREERTRLVDGWLVETRAYATFEMMGQLQGVRLDSKVSLDEEMRLRSASGKVEAFGLQLRALAQYTGEAFDVTLYLDGEQERFQVPFEQ